MSSIALAFIQMAADEGVQAATNELSRINLALETIGEVGSIEERRHAAAIMASVKTAFQQITETNAVRIASEPFEYLDENDQFQLGDEARAENSGWFPIIDSVGKSLAERKEWVAARRPR